MTGERGRAICATCPECQPCLAWAVAHPVAAVGIWGGLSDKDRRRIRRLERKTGMTLTDNPEKARRIADLWTRRPQLSEADVIAQVDAELAAEAEQRAEREAELRELDASFDAMSRCACCLVATRTSVRDGFCNDCRPVVAELVTERRRNEVVKGRTRHELALAYLERREA
jgi:hypothetical protein